MKNLLFKTMGLSALALWALVALTVISCQSEIEEIDNGGNQQDVITANSELAVLMQRSSARDGDFDDILDGISCGNIQLPVTIDLNGLTLIIDSEADFEIIREILSEFDDDDDKINFVFPITIILTNHTEIVINNEDELEDLIEACQNDDDDDEIECLDFVYPITFLTFNSNNEQLGSFTVNSDAEMYLFLVGLESGVRASIQFPIQVKFKNGNTRTINNNDELQTAIRQAEADCDDDDGSVNGEPFVRILTDGFWYLNEITSDEDDADDNPINACSYSAFKFSFSENGNVRAESNNRVVEGRWFISSDDGVLEFEMEFEGDDDLFDELEEDWDVFRYSAESFKLTDDDEYVIFKRVPLQCSTPNNVAQLAEFLSIGTWAVASYTDDDNDDSSNYENYVITFSANGSLTAVKDSDTVTGTWAVSLDGGQLKLQLNFNADDPFDELEDDWDVVAYTALRVELKDFDDDDDTKDGYDRLVLEKIL